MAYISKITLPNGSTYDVKDVRLCSPNLLINPDFSVNQRGQTEYTTSGYTFDGWSINVGNVSKNDAGGVIINNTASSAMRYRQYIELDFAQLLGKIITLSVCVDGVVYSATGDVPTEEPTAQTNILQIVVSASLSINLNYLPAKKAFDLYFYVVSGTTFALSWAKLELGSAATPYCPPDPAYELIKCQRYYQIRSTGDIAATDMRPSMHTITDIKQRGDGTYEYIAEL